jgi:hypothetical protein
MEAFASVDRDELGLVVLCLGEDETPPADPRIVAWPYEYVDRDVYDRRLAALDVVALPFDPDGQMLTTGVVGDVVGLGLPALVSDWPYLVESLGEAGIPVGSTTTSIAQGLRDLSIEQLDAARAVSASLQRNLAWDVLGSHTLGLFEQLV